MAGTIRFRPLLIAAILCSILTLPVAWVYREYISSDGLSYLDMAVRAVQHGPMPLLTNAYWSPVYPALLAEILKLLHPSPVSEAAVAHVLDWFICAGTYLSFSFFLWNLLRWVGPDSFSRTQRFGMMAFAYSLLFVSNMDVTLWLVGPNVLMEGIVYLAAGLCMRLSLAAPRLIHYAFLGACLALGYAAKAALFPLSLLLITMLFVRAARRKGALVTAAVFLLVTSPLVVVLSHNKERLTFGDAGRLTYAWYVGEVPRYWETRLPDPNTLPRRPKQLSADPLILKFEGPFDVTYSYWYDPSYWYEGVPANFTVARQARQFLRIVGMAPKLMLSGSNLFQLNRRWIPIWVGLVAFVIFGLRIRNVYRATGADQAWLFLWPAAAFLLFASVLIEYRYLVPFAVLGWTALFAMAGKVVDARKWIAITVAVSVGLVLFYGAEYKQDVARALRHSGANNPVLKARLESVGIKPGDELGSIGFADYAYYGRLAGAKFTMQMPAPDRVATAKLPAEEVIRVLDTFRRNGAKAVFSSVRPAFDNDSGWIEIGGRNYVRILR